MPYRFVAVFLKVRTSTPIFSARYTCTFSRSMWFFFQSVVHVLIVTPPHFKLKVCIVLFKVMIKHLSVVSLFELHIINSLNSSFSCKDRNIRGIENWDLETLNVWLHPHSFPVSGTRYNYTLYM